MNLMDNKNKQDKPLHDHKICPNCEFVTTFDKKTSSIYNFWFYCNDYVPTGHINFSRLRTDVTITPLIDSQDTYYSSYVPYKPNDTSIDNLVVDVPNFNFLMGKDSDGNRFTGT